MTRTHQTWGSPRATSTSMTCPECGLRFARDIRRVIDTQCDPAKALEIIAKDASMSCPFCGFTIECSLPILYLDPKHNAYIFLVYGDKDAELTSELFMTGEVDISEAFGEGAIKRVARGRRSLYSTALAISKGLDDRVIEVLKIDLLKVLMEEDGLLMDDDDPIEHYSLMDVRDDTLFFEIETGASKVEATTTMDSYKIIERQMKQSSLAELQNYVVDEDWGFYAYQVLVREGLL